MKLLLYCCKEKMQKDLLWSNNLDYFFLDGAYNRLIDNLPKHLLNGKIVAECDFEVEDIEKFYCCGDIIQTKTMTYEALLGRSCLTDDEFKEYNPTKAIHIKNLHIFDKPKELNEVYKIENVGGMLFTKPLTQAPQNMMRVSVNPWDYATYEPNDINVLISIQPQWMCLILNHIKDVEVRRVVLKEMLK